MDQNHIEIFQQRCLLIANIDSINDKLRIVKQHIFKQYESQLEQDYLYHDLEKQDQAGCLPCCGERKKIKIIEKKAGSNVDYEQIEKDLNIQLIQYENQLESLEFKLIQRLKQ